jgi:hypothetical protein
MTEYLCGPKEPVFTAIAFQAFLPTTDDTRYQLTVSILRHAACSPNDYQTETRKLLLVAKREALQLFIDADGKQYIAV